MALHVINLTYKELPAPVQLPGVRSSVRSAPVKYKATAKRTDKKVRKERDTLKWKSNGDYITLALRPSSMFSPHLFSTDPAFCKEHNIKVGEPVRILKKGPFKYWCGFKDKKTGEAIGYPVTKTIGVEDPGHP
jgi:hypothetical protein